MSNIVDFHSHILPGIDDGSASIDESCAMLQMMQQQGIKKVVATPHFYAQHDSVDAFLQRREAASTLLQQTIAQGKLPDVIIGAEVYFFRGISESQVLHELTIGAKPCILIEMPDSKWTDSMYRELEGIYVNHGITPIIAHVERYFGRFRTFGIPERLEELPVLVQANASFILNPSTARMASRMLKRGQIHLLGSDCHNLRSRAPNLGSAVEKIRRDLGQAAIDQIEVFQNIVLT